MKRKTAGGCTLIHIQLCPIFIYECTHQSMLQHCVVLHLFKQVFSEAGRHSSSPVSLAIRGLYICTYETQSNSASKRIHRRAAPRFKLREQRDDATTRYTELVTAQAQRSFDIVHKTVSMHPPPPPKCSPAKNSIYLKCEPDTDRKSCLSGCVSSNIHSWVKAPGVYFEQEMSSRKPPTHQERTCTRVVVQIRRGEADGEICPSIIGHVVYDILIF